MNADKIKAGRHSGLTEIQWTKEISVWSKFLRWAQIVKIILVITII
jgi:hypothetical protein